jgi:hypothetical protein
MDSLIRHQVSVARAAIGSSDAMQSNDFPNESGRTDRIASAEFVSVRYFFLFPNIVGLPDCKTRAT